MKEGKERERETKLEDYREESARRKVGREFERGKSKRQEGGGCEAMMGVMVGEGGLVFM